MAEKRMYSKKITDSDDFIQMPASSQALYFHLNQGADDDGFNNQIQIAMLKAHASIDDLKVLMTKNFIMRFESGVVVVKHWWIHNTLRKDRYTPTNFQEELKLLGIKDNKAYTFDKNQCWLSNGCQTVAIDKNREEKISIDKDKKENIKKEKFTPPTFEEVKEYAICRGREDLAKRFYDFFTVGNWTDSKGQKVKNWKQKFITWETHNSNGKSDVKLNETDREYLIRKKYSKEWVMALTEEQLKETVNKARKLYGE